jgi:predicted nucleic acid-binding protein
MSFLVDTNVLLRSVEPLHPQHAVAVEAVRGEVQRIEGLLSLLPDIPTIYSIWKTLLVEQGVSGVQVHDARLVATMKAHGVAGLLTFNVNDFRRYAGIELQDPHGVLER